MIVYATRLCGFVLPALPPFFALYCLLGLYVDFFFWDEWNVLVRFSTYIFDRNPYAWHILWEPHFSHRLVLLKILSAFNFHVFAGAQLPLLVFAWLVQVGLLIASLGRLRSLAAGGSLRRLTMALCLSAVLFTPSMALAWLWPVCLQQVLTSALFCLTMFQLRRLDTEARPWLPALMAVLCTFASGNGIVVWPTAIVLGMLLHIPPRRLGTFAAVGIVTLTAFFHDLPLEAVGDEVKHAREKALYCIAFIGSPFSHGSVEIAGACGAVGLAAYIVLTCIALYRRDRDMYIDLSVGGIALASALAGAGYRIGLGGAEQALVDRYIPLVVPFWLGVLLGSFRAASRSDVPAKLLLVAVTGLTCLATVMPLAASRPFDPEAFAGSSHAYVRLAREALKEGVFVSSATNPWVNLFPEPQGVLAGVINLRHYSVGMFRDTQGWRRELGSEAGTWGTLCAECPPAGTLAAVEEPYGDLDPCDAGLEKGAVVSGMLSIKSSDVKDVLIVDDRRRVVGKGFPIGQFRFGIDPTELLHWSPRRWIGFVSGGHINQGASDREITGVIRLRKSTELVPLNGAIPIGRVLTACH